MQTIRIYGQDMEMERCAMFITKSGKRQKTEGIELPNQERIRKLGEKETNKYSGILEAGTIKQVEMKEKKLKKDYLTNEETTRN